jgi:hypothetical protein
VSSQFTVVPSGDPVEPLRTLFPDIWNSLLEYADPDTPFLMYSGLGEVLLERRDDEALWARASRFFEEVVNQPDQTVKDCLAGTFERLSDSDISDAIEKRLGRESRKLFRRCRL